MVNFTYYAPTKVVFGRGVEDQVGSLVKEQNCKKVLVHYGTGSVQRSGLLDRVYASLDEAGIEYVSLGGAVPNPRLALVHKGIELCKKEGVDFILAVGGGSAIDSAKGIAYGAVVDHDVWDFYDGKATVQNALGVGCVLTIAAAGSEMSDSSVLTNEETGVKCGIASPFGRCKFALMNPELTMTLPAYQTACGVADILMHTMERYFTPEEPMEVTQGIGEALMRTVIEQGHRLTRDPQDYNARAEVMWAGSLSHNDLTSCGGTRGDWATHALGHELSAKYDLAHGAALTVMWGSWARYVYKQNVERFAKFATDVMGLPELDSAEETALSGIEEMEGFFWALELPTSMGEADIRMTDEQIHTLAVRCSREGKRTIGGLVKLDEKQIEEIYRAAQ